MGCIGRFSWGTYLEVQLANMTVRLNRLNDVLVYVAI